MVLWTDDDVETFVQARAPEKYLKTYNKYIHPIQKIDAFRVVLLKNHGGLYVDLDNECMSEPKFAAGCNVVLAEQPATGEVKQWNRFEAIATKEAAKMGLSKEVGAKRIASLVPVQNSLMGSVPNHPLWDHAFSLMIEQGPKWYTLTQKVHDTTGVDIISKVYARGALAENNLRNANVCVLSSNDWHGDDSSAVKPQYVLHHGTHTWSTSKGDFGSGLVIVAIVLIGLPVAYVLFKLK